MITILSGAGASYAVNREKYPTTVAYLERLPLDIKSNEIFKMFQDMLEREDRVSQLDVEQFLWEMKEVHEVMDGLANAQTALGASYKFALRALLSRVRDLNKSRQNLGIADNEPIESIKKFRDQLGNLRAEIEQNVFALYGEEPKPTDLSENWLYLLAALHAEQRKVAFFTLNYDLIPETLAGYFKDRGWSVANGRELGGRAILNTAFWTEREYENGATHDLTITKLHGSIDWRRTIGNAINIGNTEFSGSLDKHLLLYPGYDKASHEEPFAGFHEYFRFCLAASEAIIIIGYAFRDKSVNSLIDRALSAAGERRAFIIDVNPNMPLPLENNEKWSIHTGQGQGFCRLAVDELMADLIGKCGPHAKG